MNIVEFLFAPWLSYYWTVALTVTAVAFAIRAAFTARLYRRKLLCLGLVSVALFGALFATVTAYNQFPPISIIQFLGAVALNFIFFVLGIERVQLEDIPVPNKHEVEKLLNEGLRSQKEWLTQDEYELACEFMRLDQVYTRKKLTPERVRVLAMIAKH